MPTPSPIVSMQHVGLRYQRKTSIFDRRKRDFWALRDVSLDLFQGETLGIVGRNGTGKSTLLRIIARILRPTRGTVAFQPHCNATLLSLQVGFLPHLSGRQNAILSGLLLGLSRREIVSKMDEIIAFSELADFIDEPLHTYSSGMRARLGFATAFQVDPDLLLIDEVLGVGDSSFAKKSSDALREKVKSNKTVVLVSHAAPTLVELCNRAVWIEDGKTVLQGETQNVLDAYRKSWKRP